MKKVRLDRPKAFDYVPSEKAKKKRAENKKKGKK